MPNLDGGKCFDMEAGIQRAQASEKFQVPFAWESRMKAADHVNFGNPEAKRLMCCLDDLGDGQFECVRVTFPGTKRAELARKNADVGIVDVPIQDIGGAISVFSLPDDICDQPERINVGGAIEARGFVLVNSFSCHDLIADRAQFLRNESDACETFHKLNLTQDHSRIKLRQISSVPKQHLELQRVVEDTMSLAHRMLNPSMDQVESVEPEVGWMARIREGDMEAFRLLVEMHQARVIGTISKMLGSDAESEDLAQQVFIRIWKSAPRYRPTAKFTTWLFRITRNLVFNELRRKRHFADQSEEIAEPVERAEREPDRILLEGELQHAIQEAINQLPESQRLAIILRRYEEMPYEDIAKVMGTSVPAVKSILFRARAELRERLEKYQA